MIDPTYLNQLVEEALALEDAFLVSLEVGPGDRIELLADHMGGLTLERISTITRHIRQQLDDQEYDYSLEVSSPGVGQPLLKEKQYEKNVGREVEVLTLEGEKIEATFTDFKEGIVFLQYKTREPKPVGKGKITVVKKREIPLEEIKSTRVLIKF